MSSVRLPAVHVSPLYLIDAALVATAVLMWTTSHTVAAFHAVILIPRDAPDAAAIK